MNNDTAIKGNGEGKICRHCRTAKRSEYGFLLRHFGLLREDVYNIMSEDYSKLEGYNPDADLWSWLRTAHRICADQRG